MIDDLAELSAQLEQEHLNDDVRRAILVRGDAAAGQLIEVICSASADDVDMHWILVNAAKLLGELKSNALAVRLLELIDTRWEDNGRNLLDYLGEALRAMGPLAVAPTLALYERTDREELRDCLTFILAGCGVKTEEIFQILLRHFQRQPDISAGNLGEYGDERAMPVLSAAFDSYEVPEGNSIFFGQGAIELAASIQQLGGELTPAQQAKRQAVIDRRRLLAESYLDADDEDDDRWYDDCGESHDDGFDDHWCDDCGESHDIQRPRKRTAAKLGRNEACWCGSGKKYKKCHETADQSSLYG